MAHPHHGRASSVRAGAGSVLGVALPPAHSRCSINTRRMLTGTRKPGSGLGSQTGDWAGYSIPLSMQPPPGHPAWKSCERSHQILTPQTLPVHLLCAGAGASRQATSTRAGRQGGVGGIACRHTRTDARRSGHSVGRVPFTRGLCATPRPHLSLFAPKRRFGELRGGRRTSEQPPPRIQTVSQAQGFITVSGAAAQPPIRPAPLWLECGPVSSWPFDI